jgi:hypothetical protein
MLSAYTVNERGYPDGAIDAALRGIGASPTVSFRYDLLNGEGAEIGDLSAGMESGRVSFNAGRAAKRTVTFELNENGLKLAREINFMRSLFYTIPQLKTIQNPISTCDGFNSCSRKGINGTTESIHNIVKSFEHLVTKTVTAQPCPDLFNRVHFRGIGRQGYDFNIAGDDYPPNCAIVRRRRQERCNHRGKSLKARKEKHS